MSITGVRSRYVATLAGGVLILLGLTPKMGAIVEGIQRSVLGGAGIALFGMVAAGASGRSPRCSPTTATQSNNRNILVVAIALGVAMIPGVLDDFSNAFPGWFRTIFHSGISAGAIVAIVLNLLLNSDKQRANYEAAEAGGVSAHDADRENPQVEPYGEAAQIPR